MVITPDFFFEALEQSNTEFISLCHEDNGVLRKFIENCDDDYRRQWAQHFIRVNDIEIENTMEEIVNDSRRAEEFERLPGGRQSDIFSGDENNTGNAQTADGQHKESDPIA